MLTVPVFLACVLVSGCEGAVIEGLRLSGDGWPREGRVEVRVNGQWGTVCDHNWDDADSVVTCRSLGLTGGAAKRAAFFGPGSGPVQVSDVSCRGLEPSLALCPCSNETSQCRHSRDAGVVCGAVSESEQGLLPPNVTEVRYGVASKIGRKLTDGGSERAVFNKLPTQTARPQPSLKRLWSNKKSQSNDTKTNRDVPTTLVAQSLVSVDVQTEKNLSRTASAHLSSKEIRSHTNIPIKRPTTVRTKPHVPTEVGADRNTPTTTQTSVHLATTIRQSSLKEGVDADLPRTRRLKRKKYKRHTKTVRNTEDVDPLQHEQALSRQRPKRQDTLGNVASITISTDTISNSSVPGRRSRGPSETVVWSLAAGSALLAAFMIGGAYYYYMTRRKRTKKKPGEPEPKKPGAVASPSKSILKKISSYGPPTLPPDISEVSTTEASTTSCEPSTSQSASVIKEPLNQVILECKL